MTLRDLVVAVRRLHEKVRAAVIAAAEAHSTEDLSQIAADGPGDTVYALDALTEAPLVDFFAREIARDVPLAIVGEGIPGGRLILPKNASAADVRWHVIVDPVDGTRGLMYQKRSGWILTGIAPNRGPATGLHDIEAAVQTEIPLLKQHLADALWAIRGEGVRAERWNRLTGDRVPLVLQPSRAPTLAHGFATVARFFPGRRDVLAAIDDEIIASVVGAPRPGKAACFEDQYLSTGGQLYELMAGHDRFVADLRPLVYGDAAGLCCHPYDVCTELIARELGVIVTDERGLPLSAPLSVEPNLAWIGYANQSIRRLVEPALRRALTSRGLM